MLCAVCAHSDYRNDVMIKLMNAFMQKFNNMNLPDAVHNAGADGASPRPHASTLASAPLSPESILSHQTDALCSSHPSPKTQ